MFASAANLQPFNCCFLRSLSNNKCLIVNTLVIHYMPLQHIVLCCPIVFISYGAVTYHWIKVRDAEWTEKNAKNVYTVVEVR